MAHSALTLATPCQDQMLTVAALRTAIGHFEPDELAEAKLALERARMECEDLRSAALTPSGRTSWRNLAEELNGQMGRAEDLIEDARAGALEAVDSNGNRSDLRVALVRANNLLVDAGRTLNGEGSNDDEESGDD